MNMNNKIKLNKFYVHCGFCCARKISTLNNILLDEGMNLIIDQLDIFNVFQKLYKETRRERILNEKTIKVLMPDECRQNLSALLNKLKDSSPN